MSEPDDDQAAQDDELFSSRQAKPDITDYDTEGVEGGYPHEWRLSTICNIERQYLSADK